MKPQAMFRGAGCLLSTCAVVIGFCAADACAAESAGFTRADWDAIMRWVNFIILAVLIIKYARGPLTDFFQNKRNEVASLLDRYERQRDETEAKISESRRLLAESAKRLKTVEERIIAEGEHRKQNIIEAARSESRMMLETAQLKIAAQLHDAQYKLKAEIIDAATQKAMVALPSVLTAADHDRLLHQWMEAAGR